MRNREYLNNKCLYDILVDLSESLSKEYTTCILFLLTHEVQNCNLNCKKCI